MFSQSACEGPHAGTGTVDEGSGGLTVSPGVGAATVGSNGEAVSIAEVHANMGKANSINRPHARIQNRVEAEIVLILASPYSLKADMVLAGWPVQNRYPVFPTCFNDDFAEMRQALDCGAHQNPFSIFYFPSYYHWYKFPHFNIGALHENNSAARKSARPT